MRRSYISPEYQTKAVYGTLNMLEESTFFGAKMLEIEDSIVIDTLDIIYYQNQNGEQLDLSIESSFASIVYSSSDNKKSNHTLVLDPSQPKSQLDNNTRWILTIDLKTIITDYLFATLKKFRTFEGIKNDMNIYANTDTAIKSYINYNILNRYRYKTIQLYINYVDLRNQNTLRYNNTWNKNSINTSNLLTKLQTETEFDESSIKVTFNQEKPSSTYRFDYYFNIIFEKI
jgi:hypothetical protein